MAGPTRNYEMNKQDKINENLEKVVASSARVAPEPDKPETIPPNLFSGFTKRMEFFGDREGFRRRYFNDDKGGTNIGMALRSGWTFVERDEVQLNAAVTPRNTDLGSKVSLWVGTDADGSPMHAYLMEKPQWLCDKHDNDPGGREAYHRQLEEQIMQGTLGQKAGERRYSSAHQYPGSPSTLPPISVGTIIAR